MIRPSLYNKTQTIQDTSMRIETLYTHTSTGSSVQLTGNVDVCACLHRVT